MFLLDREEFQSTNMPNTPKQVPIVDKSQRNFRLEVWELLMKLR